MHRSLKLLAVLATIKTALALGSLAAWAQTPGSLDPAAPDVAAPLAAPLSAFAGPIVHIVDAGGRIGTLDLATGARELLVYSTVFTDVAFCPNGRLYAIDFTRLYELKGLGFTVTDIGPLSNGGMNALTCLPGNKLLGASYTTSKIWSIDRSTAATTLFMSLPGLRSGGDLVVHEKNLVLATSTGKLVFIDPKKKKVLKTVATGLSNLFGLVSIGPKELYGLSGTKVYTINGKGKPSLKFDFAGAGLSSVNGAAFNGNFR